MDQGTAEAISVMEKQMAEKDQKIAELQRSVVWVQGTLEKMSMRIATLESAANAFVKGLGK